VILHERYVDHAAHVVAGAAVLDLVDLAFDPRIELRRVGLVRDYAQRAGL
jgi:hypothetical protein